MRTYTYMYLDTNTNTPQVVDIPPCLALGTEAIEPDAMRRPPRRPGKAILGCVFLRVYGSTRTNATALSNPSHNRTDTHRKRYTLALLLQAVSMGLLGFAAYAIALDVEKLSETQARVCLFRGSVWCSYSVEREHVCVADGSPCIFITVLLRPNDSTIPQARSEAFAVIFLVQCFHAFMSRSIRNSLLTSGAFSCHSACIRRSFIKPKA